MDDMVLVLSDTATRDSELFVKWAQAADLAKKRELASKIFSSFPNAFMNDAFRYKNLPALSKGLLEFENLIALVRGGMAGKFYRDHLNHSLRVFLLTRKIASEGILENRCDLTSLGLAALFHDIAYPVQEAEEVFSTISTRLSECYSSLTLGQPAKNYKSKRDLSNFIRFILTSIEDKFLEESPHFIVPVFNDFQNCKHGFFSAFEVYSMLWTEVDYSYGRCNKAVRDALLAICLHDSEVFDHISGLERYHQKGSSRIRLDKFPELFFLVLADELQEWNRPICSSKEGQFNSTQTSPCLVEIELGTVQDQNRKLRAKPCVKAKLDYTETFEGFHPMLQTLAKIASLSRLDTRQCRLEISFELPCYNLVSEGVTHTLEDVEVHGMPAYAYCYDFKNEQVGDFLRISTKSQNPPFKSFDGIVLEFNDRLRLFFKCHGEKSEIGKDDFGWVHFRTTEHAHA